MTLQLYNSLTRKKEDFKPINKGRVGIYVCGPTVYGHAHLGHAKSYISFDILVRYLKYLGYSVSYVQNITDVGHLTDDADEGEDKILKKARTEKKHPMAIAEYYTRSYFEDMDRLNCLRPDISPRATGHITEQIDTVRKLLDKGFAYEVNGSVYYDVTKFKEYGKLSGRNIEDMLAGARVEVSPDKKNPADFALWKKAEANHIMQWPSPWGPGYPGWHLECSVMSTKYLGQPFDIHGGGIENQFPHHDCEIAQAEAAEGKSFANFWLHNNMVTVDGQKMGKSLNNFITLKEVFDKGHERLSRTYDPIAVRQLILNSHYRSPLDFSDAALTAAQSGFDKITTSVKNIRKAINSAPDGSIDSEISKQLKHLKDKFESAMNDDLNTSIALSVIFDMTRLANTLIEENANKAELSALDDLFKKLGGDVLGVVLEKYPETSAICNDKYIELFIDLRNKARDEKNFEFADFTRDRLKNIGVELRDTPEGTEWDITQIEPAGE
ncbi:MAG: cysteine--tRNA ligase [Planctomycetota bacterium]|jgi:cysteinyl-tRNA synthetase